MALGGFFLAALMSAPAWGAAPPQPGTLNYVEGQVNLNATGKRFKSAKFDKKKNEDDFYRWASLRSSYLADANADAARTYIVGGGWGPRWYGTGWYWDPWFSAYTFIPANGIFYGPFGRFGYGHVYRPPVAVGNRGGFAVPRGGFNSGAFAGATTYAATAANGLIKFPARSNSIETASSIASSGFRSI